MNELSHTDDSGKAHMVDVTPKPVQIRTARATGFIRLSPAVISLVKDNQLKKGDVLCVAQIAGIQAAKQTASLIPLCHPLAITTVEVKCLLESQGVTVNSMVRCCGQTGVEMEALTAVSVALLTVYDMCKAVDNKMKLENIYLLEKTKV